MGMQDRDYYREWWAKKTGYVERTPFRLPASHGAKRQPWHPVLVLLLAVFIFLFVYGVFKLVLAFLGH